MTNKEILKKQIIYRSAHRGSKEMDILLGNFVKEHIDDFSDDDLKNLEQIFKILSIDEVTGMMINDLKKYNVIKCCFRSSLPPTS